MIERYSRQSFLGDQHAIGVCIAGIVGLGGGGSHVVQQLAHIGFQHFRIFDPDVVEDSNLNRLVGATTLDAMFGVPKTATAYRMIKGLQPDAEVAFFPFPWQDVASSLKECDLVFGCLDSFAARRDLESCTRRYLIPYIDIGMDVHCVGDEPPRMAGQVILSMPGGPCMTCLGFLGEAVLAKEGTAYGDAGPRPQVVWPNAVLASTAVGIAVDLLTGWSRSTFGPVYLQYIGNDGTIQPHVRLKYLPAQPCPHYPCRNVGDPIPVAL